MLYSEVVTAYLARRQADGHPKRTLDGDRVEAWSILRFLGRDLTLEAIRKLHPNLLAEWIDWLRQTEATKARPRSLPRDFSPASLARVLAAPPLSMGRPRRESTIMRHLQHGRQLIAWLGQSQKLDRKRMPRPRKLPPMVPDFDEIAEYWRGVLRGRQGDATSAERRRVVLSQAAMLLSGMRKEEALFCERGCLEGQWLLLRPDWVKTGVPRLVCLNGQALGIAAALQGQLTFGFAAGKRHRVLGWPWSLSHWDHTVAACGLQPFAKPQQTMRQRCSSWLRKRDPDAESLQLGHGGGGVVSTFYLDTLQELPAIMAGLRLPDLAVEGFQWPAAIEASPRVPRRLYEELDALLNQRRAA
jgi:hypothetical protein